jgi:DnaJ-class molecular chaperone
MTERLVCKKCNGQGYLPNHIHVNEGRCWACEGRGWTTQETRDLKRAEYLMTHSKAFQDLCEDYNTKKVTREEYRIKRNELARKYGAEEIPEPKPASKSISLY